jgi:hypothetical protein
MNVDPVDDCTFWFTANYSPATQWATRISAFRFDACSGEPVPTPTPTNLPYPTEQLIVNGGFELKNEDNSPNLTPWSVKNPTGDKIKCNKDTNNDGEIDKFFSHTGTCAFMFKGVPGEASKLQQVYDPSNTLAVFAADDTLLLTAYVDARASLVDAIIKLKIKYSDNTPTGKASRVLSQTTGYDEVTLPYTIQSENVVKIKLIFDHRTPSGKLFIDDVTLLWSLIGTPTRERKTGGELIPLP